MFTGNNGNVITDLNSILTEIILDRLLTLPGSRPLFPAYGAGIDDYVDTPGVAFAESGNIIPVIQRALSGAEEFTVTSVRVTPNEGVATILITGTTPRGVPFSITVPIG